MRTTRNSITKRFYAESVRSPWYFDAHETSSPVVYVIKKKQSWCSKTSRLENMMLASQSNYWELDQENDRVSTFHARWGIGHSCLEYQNTCRRCKPSNHIISKYCIDVVYLPETRLPHAISRVIVKHGYEQRLRILLWCLGQLRGKCHSDYLMWKNYSFRFDWVEASKLCGLWEKSKEKEKVKWN